MTRIRKLAWIFLIISGIIHLLSAVGHIILPSVLKWDAVVSEVPSVIKGMEVSNKTILYLFNSEFAYIAVGISVLSFIYAPGLKKGKRSASLFCIYWSTFLFYRAIIQVYYFDLSFMSLLLLSNILLLLAIYIFPLFFLREFSG